MSGKSKIEWTEKVWNPVTGCSKCSPGCLNCYAEKFAKRLNRMNKYKYRNGFEITLHKEELDTPLKWKKPSRIFVNSMSDTFHEKIPIEFIFQIFNTMFNCIQHVFMVLTKRPENIPEKLNWPDNAWCGVTVCTQEEADKKIPILINIPAKIRFVSIEPMLEKIDLQYPTFNGADSLYFLPGLHWVIVGGESGHSARALQLDWVRSIRDQCVDAKIPFFFKQWGKWVPSNQKHNHPDGMLLNENQVLYADDDGTFSNIGIGKTPSDVLMHRVDKKNENSFLDGRKWNQYPEVN